LNAKYNPNNLCLESEKMRESEGKLKKIGKTILKEIQTKIESLRK
jgi:hypothetical protein